MLDFKQLKGISIWHGPDEIRKGDTLEALKKQFLMEGFETLDSIVLDNPTLGQVMDAAVTMPFMSEKRVVIARDWAPLTQGKEGKGKDPDEIDRLISWSKEAPLTSIIVFFYRNELDTKKSNFKKAQTQIQIIDFQHPNDDELFLIIDERLTEFNKKMSNPVKRTFVERTGNDLRRVYLELDKLIAFTDKRREITNSDVEQIVTLSLDVKIYEILSKLLQHDLASAQTIVNELVLEGENYMKILLSLESQLRRIFLMRRALDQHKADKVAGKEIDPKMSDGAAYMAAKQARTRKAEVWEDFYRLCNEAELDAKSKNLDNSAVLLKVMQHIAS